MPQSKRENYGFSLFHLPILLGLTSLIYPAVGSLSVVWGVSLVLVIGVPWLFKRFIEDPSNRLGRHSPTLRYGRTCPWWPLDGVQPLASIPHAANRMIEDSRLERAWGDIVSEQAYPPPTRVAAVMTSHNRRLTTLACLEELSVQKLGEDTLVDIYLVDDGSTDGTADAVREGHPVVTILKGSGDLYWNRGMRLALARASEKAAYDFYLWVNDDIRLAPDAIDTLLRTHRDMSVHGDDRVIVAGSFCDSQGQLTYGGVRLKYRWYPFSFLKVPPGNNPISCDTMNGNLVLVPASVMALVGNLDGAFTHALGDFDFGLRARRKGCKIYIAPGYVGTCSRNPLTGSWMDNTAPLRVRLQRLLGIKGFPPHEVCHFYRVHGGWLWPLWYAYLYVRSLCRMVIQ